MDSKHARPPMGLISLQEAAKRIGVSCDTAKRMLVRGELASYRLPTGTIRLSPADVDAFLQSCKKTTQPIGGACV